VADIYSEVAEALPPGSTAVAGRDAIRMFWEGAANMGIAKVVVKTIETSGTGGDTAYEQGTYTLYGKAGDIRDDGKYIVIWRREGKSWRMYRDIWNSSRK
jgi:ketosteroid isomerase-like protein